MMHSTLQNGARQAKSNTRHTLLVLLWLAPFVFASIAQANDVLNAGGNKQILAQAGQEISSSEAADTVEQRFGGRVLKVETSREGGGVVYRVKILQDDGRIRTVSVDAKSGRIVDR